MANVSMAWPNVIDGVSVSGGGWLASLPLANVKNLRLSKVARTTDTTTTSTQFVLDLGSEPVGVGCVALVVHNLSVSAKVRICAHDTAVFTDPVYDSGWIDVWPSGVVPQELLEWEGDNFWLGTLSQNAIAGYRAPFTHYPAMPVPRRYWRIEIDDTANSDGYLQIGRVFIGKVWSPAYNMAYGMSMGYADATAMETSLTGEEFFDQRTRYRQHKFDLGYLSKEEALTYILAMQQQLGVSGEVLINMNRDDIENTPRTCFLGRMTTLNPVATPWHNVWTTSFEIREIL